MIQKEGLDILKKLQSISRRYCVLAGITTALLASAEAAEVYPGESERAFPDNVYFGDTHLHTNLSVDASGFGNDRLSPDDAYQFAKGAAVRAHNGLEAQLKRPLDFLVVADHGVNLGVLPRVAQRSPDVMATEIGRRWAKLLAEVPVLAKHVLTAETDADYARDQGLLYSGRRFYTGAWGNDYVSDEGIRGAIWHEVCANAERHNDPGRFTAFIGYEWTPPTQHPRSPNLHRNVIFEGGADEACQVLPFSFRESPNVEDLWAYLKDYEERVGGKVLAIPHNGNLSAGVMFGPNDFDGNPISLDYARTRARFEPLYEVTQYKGDGEAHPVLSPTDEFADFETWHVPGFFGQRPDGWADLKQYEYARPALKRGLSYQVSMGVNPFKFGMIGSTDAHTSLATADEDNFWGKLAFYEPSPWRAKRSWHFGASGYAAVWATQNTREALFAAMARRETYATTGPRMMVRFFGGWDFVGDDAFRPDLADVGYTRGVPMGGDLMDGPEGEAPSFLIRAAKDPIGANLDRVQIIKGWRDAAGELHEQVHDVALSDGRKLSRSGKVRPVGTTVDVHQASYLNSIGAAELSVTWRDPDFDPDELAFYYVRVIEIPTPRWTAYDAKRFGIKDMPAAAPMTVQDRAYTSPIWYTPADRR
ncbi:MAG: DUF3604 domain-containing protein [Proteobacteria bacterium]|nr:DUF3604 domain-containing protein [Pseudomonadota bacterium]MDA1300993.1 DUF3604 domain-containing protein [Pseudomonadota bacterium]